jgi:hypothetical protein
MVRSSGFLLLAALVPFDGSPVPVPVMSVCELSKGFPGFRDKVMTVPLM